MLTFPHPHEVLPVLPVNFVTYLPGCSRSGMKDGASVHRKSHAFARCVMRSAAREAGAWMVIVDGPQPKAATVGGREVADHEMAVAMGA